MAKVTYQNLFRLFPRLSGMTGMCARRSLFFLLIRYNSLIHFVLFAFLFIVISGICSIITPFLLPPSLPPSLTLPPSQTLPNPSFLTIPLLPPPPFSSRDLIAGTAFTEAAEFLDIYQLKVRTALPPARTTVPRPQAPHTHADTLSQTLSHRHSLTLIHFLTHTHTYPHKHTLT